MFFSDEINKTPASKVPSQFQAIIFEDDDSKAKTSNLTRAIPASLLPIANQPALHYILLWLEKANVKDVIIVLSPTSNLEAEAQLTHYLTKVYQGSVKVELYPVDPSVRSLQALTMLKSRIQNDFIVFGSSFLCDVPLQKILSSHILKKPMMTAYFYESLKAESSSNENVEYPLIGVEPNLSRLVYLNNKVKKDEDLSIKMSLLNRFSRVNFHRSLLNSDLYIFSHWILDFIASQPNLNKVCDDLVPLLIKLQSRPTLPQTSELKKYINPKTPISHELVNRYTTTANKNQNFSATDPSSSTDELPSALQCNILIERSGVQGKLDSIISYSELNKQFSKTIPSQDRVHASVELEPMAQIGPDSMVGANSRINERTSIKKSIVGSNCVIGKQVKISNSIIMDHVVIEDNVKLENCIICSRAKIMEKAQLKDCEVADSIIINKNVTKKGEAIIDQ